MEKIRNEHDVLINVVELASELAHNQLEKDYSDLITIYKETDEPDTYYTEEAQDIFNDLYDRYYDLVLSCKSNNL